MRSSSFLLFGVVLASGCSSQVDGTGHPPQPAAPVVAPAAGEACACTSSLDAIPTVNCCQGDLVCGGTTGYTCNARTNQCVRTGTCMTWDQASEPTCEPFSGDCPDGTVCQIVNGAYHCRP